MEDLEKRGLRRKLGLLEQNLTARSLNGFYNNFAVIATFNRTLPIAEVYSVLRKMILKHSLLASNYRSEKNEIFPVPQILFGDVFEARDMIPFDIDQLLYDIELYKFNLDSDEPIFKVLLINGTVLSVIFEHGYTDGGTGTNFQKIFLQTLNELTEEEKAVSVDHNSVLFSLKEDINSLTPFPPAIDSSLQYIPDYWFVLKRWLKSCLSSQMGAFVNDHNYTKVPVTDIEGIPVSKWPGVKASLNYETYFKVFNIDSEETGKLIKLARSQKMTVTPVIEVILMQSLVTYGTIQNQEGSSYYINSMLPVNLRRFEPKEVFESRQISSRIFPGIINNIPIADLAKSAEDTSVFWDLCRKSSETTSGNSSDSKVVMNYYINTIGSYDPNSPEKMKNASHTNFLKSNGVNSRLSNLGVFKNLTTSGEYNIDDLVFTQSIGANGGAVVLNLISTEKTGINFCFTSLDGVFKDKDDFLAFCTYFKSRIIEYLHSS